MTRNELITPDGELRCRQLDVGEKYQPGDWFIREDGTRVVLKKKALNLLSDLIGVRQVSVGHKPTFRSIEEQPK